MRTFGERLEDMRIARGETIAVACLATGLDPAMWNSWELGTANPPAIDLLLQLGNYFQLSGPELERFQLAAAVSIRRCPQCRIELSYVRVAEPWQDMQLQCFRCDGTYCAFQTDENIFMSWADSVSLSALVARVFPIRERFGNWSPGHGWPADREIIDRLHSGEPTEAVGRDFKSTAQEIHALVKKLARKVWFSETNFCRSKLKQLEGN